MSVGQFLFTLLLIVGILLIIDSIVGGAILAAIAGPQMFLFAGVPQLVIGIILTYFGYQGRK